MDVWLNHRGSYILFVSGCNFVPLSCDCKRDTLGTSTDHGITSMDITFMSIQCCVGISDYGIYTDRKTTVIFMILTNVTYIIICFLVKVTWLFWRWVVHFTRYRTTTSPDYDLTFTHTSSCYVNERLTASMLCTTFLFSYQITSCLGGHNYDVSNIITWLPWLSLW